jgi:hypothetical protein
MRSLADEKHYLKYLFHWGSLTKNPLKSQFYKQFNYSTLKPVMSKNINTFVNCMPKSSFFAP